MPRPKGSRITHGMKGTAPYKCYWNMRARCTNPNHPRWKDWGGRGIRVCDRWMESFENFWADMGPTYQPGLSIERRENSLGYSLENCRWATSTAQARNRRSNHLIETAIGYLHIADAADLAGMKRETLWYQVARGVPTAGMFSDLACFKR